MKENKNHHTKKKFINDMYEFCILIREVHSSLFRDVKIIEFFPRVENYISH